jgi:hypothetical protein
VADAPAWARALVAEVCHSAGVDPPRLAWRLRPGRPTSSGVTRREAGTVSVSAGDDPADQRLTLLHELAHWLSPAPSRGRRARARTSHHDAAFYAVAFALYARHGIASADALRGESVRYPSALRHARALRIPGAEVAWREHRARLRERAASRGPLRVLVGEHRVRLVRDGRWTRCAVCGVRVVGPVLRRLRRRGGSHVLLTREVGHVPQPPQAAPNRSIGTESA